MSAAAHERYWRAQRVYPTYIRLREGGLGHERAVSLFANEWGCSRSEADTRLQRSRDEWSSMQIARRGVMAANRRRRFGNTSRAIIRRYTVERIPLNRGGYDRRGRYWGVGYALWEVTDNENERAAIVRASSAASARTKAINTASWRY
jgi:hypothetical protein